MMKRDAVHAHETSEIRGPLMCSTVSGNFSCSGIIEHWNSCNTRFLETINFLALALGVGGCDEGCGGCVDVVD